MLGVSDDVFKVENVTKMNGSGPFMSVRCLQSPKIVVSNLKDVVKGKIEWIVWMDDVVNSQIEK